MQLRRTFFASSSAVLMSYGLLTACGGDDNSSPESTDSGAKDATSADVTTTQDAAHTDSSTPDSSTPDAGPTLNAVALNNLLTVSSDIQLCFAASATGTPGTADALDMMPQPTTPLGKGDLATISVPVPTGNVRVFTYYTDSLKAQNLSGASCRQLLAASGLSPVVADAGTDGGDAGDAGAHDSGPAPDAATGVTTLVQTLDFDVSEVIASGVLNTTSKFLFLPTGCPNTTGLAAEGSPLYCGNILPNGNPEQLGDFHVFAYELSATPAASSSQVRVQGVAAFQPIVYGPPDNFFYPTVLGVAYTDAGTVGDASPPDLVLGPNADAGDPTQSEPQTNGPIDPGTDLPPLGTAVNAFIFVPPDPFDPALTQAFPFDLVLQTSGLTRADLTSGAYTLVGFGDPAQPTTLADGGSNQYFGMRLIRNDTK